MEGYGDLIEDDDAPDVVGELSELAWHAGYGAALVNLQRENSSDAAADRIMAAADSMASVDLWGDDAESWDADNRSDDE